MFGQLDTQALAVKPNPPFSVGILHPQWILIPLLLCLLLGACTTPPFNPVSGNRQMALVIHPDLVIPLATELDQFEQDLNTAGYDVWTITLEDINTPAQLRQELKNLWLNEGLVGAVFIGAIPVPTFERMVLGEVDVAPIDYYYMELDGSWQDKTDLDPANPGVLDYLGDGSGDIEPEIWVGRIDASQLSAPPTPYQGTPEVWYLKQYFAKNHAFRMGQVNSNGRALIYNAIHNSGTSNHPALAYGASKVDWISANKEDEVSVAGYKTAMGLPYEWARVDVHSTSAEHGFPLPFPGNNELVTSAGMRNVSKALFVSLRACEAADFTAPDYIAGYYLFDEAVGLTLIGLPGVSKFISDSQLYRALSGHGTEILPDGSVTPKFEYFEPMAIGDAYVYTLEHFFRNAGSTGDIPQVLYDDLFTVLLGDPTLKPPSVQQVIPNLQGAILESGGRFYPHPKKGPIEIKPIEYKAIYDTAGPQVTDREMVVWLTNAGDDRAIITSFTYQIKLANQSVVSGDLVNGIVSDASSILKIYPEESTAYVLPAYKTINPDQVLEVTIDVAYKGVSDPTVKVHNDTFTVPPDPHIAAKVVKFSIYTGNLVFVFRNDAPAALTLPPGGAEVTFDVYRDDGSNEYLGQIAETSTYSGGVVYSNERFGKHVLCGNNLSVPYSEFTALGLVPGDKLRLEMQIDPNGAITPPPINPGENPYIYLLTMPGQ